MATSRSAQNPKQVVEDPLSPSSVKTAAPVVFNRSAWIKSMNAAGKIPSEAEGKEARENFNNVVLQTAAADAQAKRIAQAKRDAEEATITGKAPATTAPATTAPATTAPATTAPVAPQTSALASLIKQFRTEQMQPKLDLYKQMQDAGTGGVTPAMRQRAADLGVTDAGFAQAMKGVRQTEPVLTGQAAEIAKKYEGKTLTLDQAQAAADIYGLVKSAMPTASEALKAARPTDAPAVATPTPNESPTKDVQVPSDAAASDTASGAAPASAKGITEALNRTPPTFWAGGREGQPEDFESQPTGKKIEAYQNAGYTPEQTKSLVGEKAMSAEEMRLSANATAPRWNPLSVIPQIDVGKDFEGTGLGATVNFINKLTNPKDYLVSDKDLQARKADEEEQKRKADEEEQKRKAEELKNAKPAAPETRTVADYAPL